MEARVIINGQATDGRFSRDFLFRVFKMGAEVTVFINGRAIFVEEDENFKLLTKED